MATKVVGFKIEILGTKDQNRELRTLQTAINDLIKENKKLKKDGKDNTKAFQNNAIALKALKTEHRQTQAAVEKSAFGARKLGNSYNDLTAKNRVLSGQLRKLSDPLGKNKKEFDRLSGSIRKNENRLKKMDSAMGRSQRNVGNYSGALKSAGGGLLKLGAALGVGFLGVQAIGRVFRSAATSIAEFQQASANLASILGETRADIKDLTDDAQRLGSITKFTATEVANLQTEFAKLGFNRQEILKATEATLELAAATGSDLVQAATVAGATVRGFGLDASETQRVVDVMALSFSSSALDISKFQTAMAIVAPVAKNAGVELEETTALLGILADRGVDASTAATSLRNIFLENAKAGRTLSESFDLINTATDKNVTALALFGKRGATAATILAENSDQADKLAKSLDRAAGAAEKMATEQLDTLTGRLDILNSAWDGFIRSVEDGEGVLGNAFNSAIKGSTELLTVLTDLNKDGFSGAVADRFIRTNDEAKAFKETIDETVISFRNQDIAAEDALVILRKKANRQIALLRENFAKGNEVAVAINLRLIKQAEAGIQAVLGGENAKLFAFIDKRIADLNKTIETNTTKTKENKEEQLVNVEARRRGIVSVIDTILKLKQEQIQYAETTQEIRKLQSEIKQLNKERKTFLEGDSLEIIDLKDSKAQSDEATEIFSAGIDDILAEEDRLADERKENRQLAASAAIDAARSISDAIFEIENQSIERKAKRDIRAAQDLSDTERTILEEQLRDGILNETQYREAKAELDKKAQKREEAIRRRQFNDQKTASLVQAAINTALAVTAALTQAPPAAYVLAAVSAAAGLAQIAVIASQQFAKGGVLPSAEGGMIEGNSHANGGVRFNVGQTQHEAEGGEVIINKRSSAMFRPQLSAINQAGGGIAFAGGGAIPRYQRGIAIPSPTAITSPRVQQQAADVIESAQEAAQAIVVQMVESDVTGIQNSVQATETQGTI